MRAQGEVTPTHWRAMVYDQYTGRGWINTNTWLSDIAAGDGRPMVAPWQTRTVITQTVTMLQAGSSAVYTAGQPLGLWLARRAQAGRMGPVKLLQEMASVLARVMPEAQADLDHLVTGYVRQRFSRYPLSKTHLATLEAASGRVRQVGLRRWLTRRLP